MFFLLLEVMIFSTVLFAQEPPAAPLPRENTCSIGINAAILAEPAMVNFRWWNKNNRGRQLIIGDEVGLAGNKERRDAMDIVFEAQIPSIEYTWLTKRNIFAGGAGYMYTGLGLSLAGHYIYDDANKRKLGSIATNLRFPVGGEHFFIKSMPFISYSVEADFYAGHWKTCYDNATEDNTAIQMVFGVTPRLFLNCYFR